MQRWIDKIPFLLAQQIEIFYFKKPQPYPTLNTPLIIVSDLRVWFYQTSFVFNNSVDFENALNSILVEWAPGDIGASAA